MIFIACKLLNFTATRWAKEKRMRLLGMKVYDSSLIENFRKFSEKLFIENYVILAFAIFNNYIGFYRHNNEFKEFFMGPGNILNSSLLILNTFLLPMYVIFKHV